MANKHIISCSVTGLKCVCDTVSIPADNAGSILIKAKFTPEWDGLIISLAYRKVWGDSETTGEALFDGGELDAKDLFLCSDYGNEEAIPASYVEFGFIGRSSGDTEGFIKASSVCSVKLADSAYISNPGVTADSLGFSSRLLKAENKANISFKQLIEHKSDKNNPHGATAAQVGAYSKDEVNGYVTALYNKIAENKSDLEGELELLSFNTQAAFNEAGKVVAGKAEANHSHTASDVGAYTKTEIDELLSSKAEETNKPVKSASRYTYYTPSTGLEIEDGVVIGIGSCRDEHIVIPELYNDGGIKKPVTAVRAGTFSELLGSDGAFIKSITFPSSIERFIIPGNDADNIINSDYCPNLSEIHMMNPNITWDDVRHPFRLLETVKDLYFAFTEKQYDNINAGKWYTLITLKNENIAAGIVPTKHFGHFVTSAVIGDINGKIGDIDVALDELHTYAQALIGGEV